MILNKSQISPKNENHQFGYPFCIILDPFWYHFSMLFWHRFLGRFWDVIFSIIYQKLSPKGSQKGFQGAGPQITRRVMDPIFDPRPLLAPFGFHFASFFLSTHRFWKDLGTLLAPVWHYFSCFLHVFSQHRFCDGFFIVFA